jgi:IS30 family transposase
MMTYTRLSGEERETISLLNAQGHTYTYIAELLGRHVSTIGREVYRHSQPGPTVEGGGYRAGLAHQRAKTQARNSHRKTAKLTSSAPMLTLVHQKLRLRWSPHQISQWLRHHQPPAFYVSPETIYQYIYLLPRGELRRELIGLLRQRKPLRKNRKADPASTQAKPQRGVIADMISITERPEEVADRSVPGHWEGDLIMGKDHKSAIGTIVERQTRYVLMVHLEAKDATSVREAFARKLRQLPASLRKTFTYDQGKEMSQHKQFAIDTKMQVFFCDPHSPWQRGTCENTNMLIRGFFPKGTDFRELSARKINFVQHALNERPRQTLDWKTPKQALNQLLLNA